MNDPKFIQLNIEVLASDATDEELDRWTHQLLVELREMDIESAELTKRESAREGSNADPTVTGSIMISTLPHLLPAIVTLIQAWTMRVPGRMVKFKGQGIEFEGSTEALQKLLATLDKGKKKNGGTHHRLAGDSTTDAPPPKK